MAIDEKAADRSKQLQIDYHQTFDTDAGRRVLVDIMAYCHVMEPLRNSVETNHILIREGRRDAALTILEKLDFDESKFRAITGGGEK